MKSNQEFTLVQLTGKYSLYVKLTDQLKKLGLGKTDKVYTYVEEIDGKKRIIIEGVK